MNEPVIEHTDIPGLLVLRLPVHGDARGWFKENWQREKMVALGLPDFTPVQNNMSFNVSPGITRGFHAEPWDKMVSVACGKVFGAWVDLREGESFGRVVTVDIDPSVAVFVPRGVGNAYQALDANTTYSYLVNEHWSAQAKDKYTYLNLADETVAVNWPIPLAQATTSQADKNHPRLAHVKPFPRGRVLVLGSNGQLGTALREVFPDAEYLDRDTLDISDSLAVATFDFDGVETIINAAAWTAVDAAEGEGRAACWAVNVDGVKNLVGAARRHRAQLVHVSSDYVFDGQREQHDEAEPFSPLGFYGATKAAGDALVQTWDRHWIVRTSWVVGSGKNFVTTMASLARRGISPSVVNDQFGRLTFASELAAAIAHLVTTGTAYGTYNVSNSGPVKSWFEIATAVFELLDAKTSVSPVSTEDYARGKNLAPRPRYSALDLTKLRNSGFIPSDADQRLAQYLVHEAPPAD